MKRLANEKSEGGEWERSRGVHNNTWQAKNRDSVWTWVYAWYVWYVWYVCVCVCVCVCVRERRKIELTVWGEKSAHSPRRDLNLYLWDTRPPCFWLNHEGRPASRQSKQTLQKLTRQLHRETIMHETLQTPIYGTATSGICNLHWVGRSVSEKDET